MAIDEQAIARVFYDLEHAKLAELAQYLGAATRLHQDSDYDRASTISTQLSQVATELQRLQINYEPSPFPSQPPTSNSLPTAQTPPPTRNKKEKRPGRDIIGASPEKASKRRKSYGVH